MNCNVGCCHLNITDRDNDIRFPVFLTYPTASIPQKVEVELRKIEAAPDAPILIGNYPVVLISHGSGGTHLGYMTIANYLAEKGYVVAMTEHYGNNRKDNHLEGTKENLQNRPSHLQLVIDTLVQHPQFQNCIDEDNIAVIGHSMGGYSALAIAGGKPWTQQREPLDVVADSRVKALVLMAPATLWFTPDQSLNNVTCPILMLLAEHDIYTPMSNAEIVRKQITTPGQLKERTIDNAGHFSFLSPFPDSRCHPDFLPSTDPDGFDRKTFHEELKEEICFFLEDHLR